MSKSRTDRTEAPFESDYARKRRLRAAGLLPEFEFTELPGFETSRSAVPQPISRPKAARITDEPVEMTVVVMSLPKNGDKNIQARNCDNPNQLVYINPVTLGKPSLYGSLTPDTKARCTVRLNSTGRSWKAISVPTIIRS
jgi:hypothetical protein